MKKTTLLKSMLLLCALIVGSGNLWADEMVFTQTSLTAGTLSGTVPTGVTAGFNNTYTQNKQQISSGNTQTLTLNNMSGYKITKLVLSMHSNSGNGSGTLAYSIDNGSSWTYLVGSSGSGLAFNNASWNGSFTTDWVDITKNVDITCGTSAVKIQIASTNKSLYCQSYTITYQSSVETGKETSVTINSTGVTNTDVYTSTIGGFLSASIVDEDEAAVDGVVSWSSDDESVATIGSDGSVTLVGAGTAIITANYAGKSGEYKSSSKTYDLTVTDSNPNVAGTENNPYTVAQAKAKVDEDNTVTTDGAYVVGIVAKKSGSSLPAAGYITYFISDDGEDANTIQCYKGMSYDGAKFSDFSDITVGDKVVVCGDLLLYNGTTYELNSGNSLVVLRKSVKTVGADGWATYITAADIEFEPENAFVVASAGTSVSLTPVTKVPSGTPLILKGKGKKWAASLDVTPAAPTNSLAISDGAGEGTTNDYVLGKKNGVAGFYKWNGGNLSADKVYLPAGVVTSAHEFLGFDIDVNNDVTTINEIKGKKAEANGVYYNLAGQRVQKPTKGLYIVNGKKVIIK